MCQQELLVLNSLRTDDLEGPSRKQDVCWWKIAFRCARSYYDVGAAQRSITIYKQRRAQLLLHR